MKLTKMKYKKLEELMPIVRKSAKVSNYKLICTMFYIIDNSCKLGVLPKEYGKCYAVYMKFNRWFQNGAIAEAIVFFL